MSFEEQVVKYIKTVHVNYGENNNENCLSEDINKKCGGDYVYLRPEYTEDINQAASGFHVLITDKEIIGQYDLAKGAWGKYRYIVTEYHSSRKIKRVWLSERMEGDGHTNDINEGRGARYLYLCWNYVK